MPQLRFDFTLLTTNIMGRYNEVESRARELLEYRSFVGGNNPQLILLAL